MTPAKPRCTATTRAGRPCRGHPLADSDPPRCHAHAGRRPPTPLKAGSVADFYSATFTAEELDALLARSPDLALRDEIATVQVATRRVMKQLQQELTPAEYCRLAGLVFSGASTIARLLRTQHDLAGDLADEFAGELAKALDELGPELGTAL